MEITGDFIPMILVIFHFAADCTMQMGPIAWSKFRISIMFLIIFVVRM